MNMKGFFLSIDFRALAAQQTYDNKSNLLCSLTISELILGCTWVISQVAQLHLRSVYKTLQRCGNRLELPMSKLKITASLGALLFVLGLLLNVTPEVMKWWQEQQQKALIAYIGNVEKRYADVETSFTTVKAVISDESAKYARHWTTELSNEVATYTADFSETGFLTVNLSQLRNAKDNATLAYKTGREIEYRLNEIEKFTTSYNSTFSNLALKASLAEKEVAEAKNSVANAEGYIDTMYNEPQYRLYQVEFKSAYIKLAEAKSKLRLAEGHLTTQLVNDNVSLDLVAAYDATIGIERIAEEAKKLASDEALDSFVAYNELAQAKTSIEEARSYIDGSSYRSEEAHDALDLVVLDYVVAHNYFWGDPDTGEKDYSLAQSKAYSVQLAADRAWRVAATPTPTFTPSATFTASPTFTPSPTYTPTPIPSKTPVPTDTPVPARPAAGNDYCWLCSDEDDDYDYGGYDNSGAFNDNDSYFDDSPSDYFDDSPSDYFNDDPFDYSGSDDWGNDGFDDGSDDWGGLGDW